MGTPRAGPGGGEEHAVVIAGGGPTGMMLAAELTLAGTDVLVVERRPSFELESSRSRGLHSRTLEVLDQRGVVDRFLAEGTADAGAGLRRGAVGHQRFPQPPQLRVGAAAEPFRAHHVPLDHRARCSHPARARGHGFRSDDDRVEVALSDGTSLRANYLVGCDGGRASCAKLPASSSLAGIRRRAGSTPKSRWRNNLSSACVAVVASGRRKAAVWVSP